MSYSKVIQQEVNNLITRRHFFKEYGIGLGSIALASLLNDEPLAKNSQSAIRNRHPELAAIPSPAGLPHFAPKAKRVIYLFQSGGPSQLDLFDPKPKLSGLRGADLPPSVRMGQRLTGMSAYQASFPVAPALFKFTRHGQSGVALTELLPHTARVADELCFIKSMYTEQINHDPAITMMTTGFQLAGRPSLGAWLSYGLGSESKELPAFVVMISVGTGRP
ncbi:MAG: DUF1501 domain-containing protein, partial [Acidobacteria bacterium]|nr:DUF1501 domain-containing protein [Acidobacteriota bacterium]